MANKSENTQYTLPGPITVTSKLYEMMGTNKFRDRFYNILLFISVLLSRKKNTAFANSRFLELIYC